jgi:uncharacterized protein (TIGR02246 family)
MCHRYQSVVSDNNSKAYRSLFAEDAIRVPPGSEPEHGADEIAQSEQRDYDIARWVIRSSPVDALRINDDWVYGIAAADVTTTEHENGATRSFRITKTWLLQRQTSGQWLIKRQIWNFK